MIFDKLLATAFLCASMSLPNVDIREPNRANQVAEFQLINGTSLDMEFENGFESVFYDVPAFSTVTISTTFNSSDDWYVAFQGDWDDERSMWYSTLDGVNLVKYPEWQYNGDYSYFNVKDMTSVCNGIGVYTEMYYSTNVDYYIDLALKGGVAHGLSDWTGTIDILPENSTCRLYRDDGTYLTLTNIKFRRANVQNSSVYDCLIYSEISTNNYLNIANNKGYTNQYFNGFATTTDPLKLQPYIKYYNQLTNRIRFNSGTYPKEPANPNGLGYTPLKNYGLTETVTGYIGYSEGGVDESVVALTGGMGLVASSFFIVSSFFGYMIFPGISIGLLLCIPLIMELIFVIIKVIKKGA